MSLQRKDLKPSFRIQNLEEFFSREAYNQFVVYSAFEIDKPHRHNQNLIRTFLGSSLLWSTEMKAAVNAQKLRRKKLSIRLLAVRYRLFLGHATQKDA